MAGDVGGYARSDPASARALLEPLLDALQVDVFEGAAGLIFQSRARRAAPPVVLDVLADREDHPIVEEHRAEDSALPSEAILDVCDPAGDYASIAARSRRLVTGNDRQHRISLPAAMDEEAATRAADLWLRQAWCGRKSLRLALSPAMLSLEPGDAICLGDAAGERFVVTRIEDGAVRDVSASGFVGAAAATVGVEAPRIRASDAASGFAPVVAFLDLPVLLGSDETAWARAAAYASPWRPLALSSSATGEGYRRRAVLDAPARMGTLVAPLPPGYPGRFAAQSIEVDLFAGTLASAADVTVLNGANGLAVACGNGGWEVLQFTDAEEIAPGRWRLGRLLRGQAGTDDAMAAGAPAGAQVVVIDDAVRPLGLEASEAGLELNWIADPLGTVLAPRPPTVFAGGRRALVPLSPVHLRAVRAAGGDIAVTWVRRGRINADSWLGADIPADEPQERYRVEILRGTAVARSGEVSAAAFVYPAADEVADFGTRQSQLSVRVRQIGGRIADGVAAEAVLTL